MLRNKGGYQLECDKPLYMGVGGGQNDNFSATYFLNDPLKDQY